MPAQTGRSFLLKIGTGTAATTVAGLRSSGFSVNGETVDVTTKDSPNNLRELLGSAGVASLSLTGAGVLQGGTQTQYFFNQVKDRTIGTYTTVFDDGDTIVSGFQVESFEATGEHNGEQTYSVSLQSSGTFSIA
jgi:TP901-1 family phage major tail protein